MITKQILFSATVFLFTACSVFQKNTLSDNQQTSDLNAQWEILSLDNKNIAKKINGIEPTIRFDLSKKEYAAITGCNNLMGGFEIKSNNKISFTRGMSTMMACDNMEVEQGLSKIFDLVTFYKIQNDTLSLLDRKKNIKGLFKLKKENNSALLKGEWELDYMGLTNKSIEQLFPTQRPILTFDIKEETLVGNGGCNSYSSTYKLDGYKLKFGSIASTKMACPSLEGESLYFKNLEKISSFSVHDNQLALIADDMAILRFKKIK